MMVDSIAQVRRNRSAEVRLRHLALPLHFDRRRANDPTSSQLHDQDFIQSVSNLLVSTLSQFVFKHAGVNVRQPASKTSYSN